MQVERDGETQVREINRGGWKHRKEGDAVQVCRKSTPSETSGNRAVLKNQSHHRCAATIRQVGR